MIQCGANALAQDKHRSNAHLFDVNPLFHPTHQELHAWGDLLKQINLQTWLSLEYEWKLEPCRKHTENVQTPHGQHPL